MPALPVTPSPCLKVNINWGVDANTQAETIHYLTCASGPSASDLNTFMAAVVSEGETAFGALASDSVGMLAASCRDLSSDMGARGEGGTPWVGTRGSALLSPATAVVVNHTILRAYRGGHPRSYLPLGVSGDVATTGLWSTAFLDAVDTAWGDFAAFLQAYSAGTVVIDKLVNVSYFGPPNRTITGSTGRVRTVSTVRAVPIIDVVQSHITRKNIGSQRRRNRDA